MRGLFILLIFIPFFILSQNGIVRGKTVNFTNNQALEGVKILIVELSTGTISDAEGNFEFTKLPPGIYTFRATATGFKPAFQNEITVTNARSITLDFSLE